MPCLSRIFPAFSMELGSQGPADAIAFTLLGAIESLLSAVVADGMSGRRTASSMELIGQGAPTSLLPSSEASA